MRKILVIRGGGLGDFILTLPVFQSLKKGFPTSQIELIGYLPFSLLGRKYISHTYAFFDSRFISLYIDSSPSEKLKDYFSSFDILISYIGDSDSIINQNLRKIRGQNLLHCNPNPLKLENHIVEHLLIPIRSLEVECEEWPIVVLDKNEKEYADKFWTKQALNDRKVVVIHPGSGSKKKRWRIERFIELSFLLEKKSGLKSVFILGEAEDDLKEVLLESMEKSKVLFNLSLIQTASIIEKSSLYIGNDSGLTHLAASLGTPTVAIFGPTHPKNWAPRGKFTSVVYNHTISCSPCLKEVRDGCSSLDCLGAISVWDVMNRTKELVN